MLGCVQKDKAMTVDGLIQKLTKLSESGNGAMKVVVYSEVDEGCDDAQTAKIISEEIGNVPYCKGDWFWDEPVVCVGQFYWKND